MADYYVWSGASGSADGSSWANAYTTLAAALSGKTAGNRFFVAHDHLENNNANTVFNSPGTIAAPIQVLSVNRGGSVPPTSADLQAGATIQVGSSFALTVGSGCSYWNGVKLYQSSGQSIAVGVDSAYAHVFENCTYHVVGQSRGVIVGSTLSGRTTSNRTVFKNCIFQLGHNSNFIAINDNVEILGGSVVGTVPATALFVANNSGRDAEAIITGLDLSNITSGLVNGGPTGGIHWKFRNCKLNASVTVLVGTIATLGGARVDLDNCDSTDSGMGASVAARFERHRLQGNVVQETTIVRSSGAADPSGNAFSQKITTNANASFPFALEGVPMPFVYVGDVGSPVTATVEILNDGATLKDDEVWGEVEYLGTDGVPLGAFASDGKADVLAAAANQSASAASWVTTGLSSPVAQKLEVAFTPREKGVYRFVPKLGKPSTTIYVDPLVSVV